MTDVFTAPVLVTLRRLLCFFPDRVWIAKYDPNGPWLSVDFEPLWGAEATPENGEQQFAIWIATGNAYRVVDSAVEDDPIDLEQLDPERDFIGVR